MNRGNIGLKRGMVELLPHQKEWEENAERTIGILRRLLGKAAVDIQHIGSTAVFSICAKPIIDLVVGVKALNDIFPYIELLRQHEIIFRGEDVSGQLLFVMGDFESDIRTHHIHIVKWQGIQWNHYINFRDYLNAYPEKARLYEEYKQRLEKQFPADRKRYTEGKQNILEQLLQEADRWKAE